MAESNCESLVQTLVQTSESNDIEMISQEPMDISPIKEEQPDSPQTPQEENYRKLIEYGLDERVASKLHEIDIADDKLELLDDLDERTLDALKDFPVDEALAVLKLFLESDLEHHVSIKDAYFCGIMKSYRHKNTLQSTSAAVVVADAQEEPDKDTVSTKARCCVRNLTQEVTEEKLKETCENLDKVKRVKIQ